MRRTPAAMPDSPVTRIRPMSPVRCTCVPPQSSTEKPPPIVSTRTSSPYFSPNSAIAPFAFAVSMSVTWISTAELARICSFTRRSTARICSGVIASKCEKSKRRRSASTSEPFCATCSPSTWRSAACSRCVAEWFNAVAWRMPGSTRAPTAAPTASVPRAMAPWCSAIAPALVVSRTSKRQPSASITPASPAWPPDSA